MVKRSAAILLLIIAMAASVRQSYGQMAAPGVSAIRINVWRNAEMSGQFELDARGYIQHPIFQTVTIAGKTVEQVRADVGQVLRKYEATPLFVVELLMRVPVLGEVRNPGVFLLPSGSTIADALNSAGGLTDRADRGGIRLVRGAAVREVKLEEVGGVTIAGGEQVTIGRSRAVFREVIAPLASILGAIAVVVTAFSNN